MPGPKQQLKVVECISWHAGFYLFELLAPPIHLRRFDVRRHDAHDIREADLNDLPEAREASR